MSATQASTVPTSGWKRAGAVVLKVLGFFVIFEPIWMLLPFAGFLYGSVLRIESLGRHPATAWLTHFVFPVLTGGWLGPVLAAVGTGLFLAGAGQIYWAKFRRMGLVSRGLYRFVRHPQYIALTLFSVGILLTWGRAITFLAFFLMMFLYYHLARSEERNCLRLFGATYERYRERTSFLIPGDRRLRPVRGRLPQLNLPVPLRGAGAFAGAVAICLALMWTIDAAKVAWRTVPFLTATVPLGPADPADARLAMNAGEAGGVAFVQAGRIAVVRGPYRNAAAPGFAERVLLRLRRSESLSKFLSFLDEPAGDAAIVFCGPFEQPSTPGTPGAQAGGAPGGRGPVPDSAGPDRVRLIVMRCALAAGASAGDALADKSKRRICGGCIAPVNMARAGGEDMVEGKAVVAGPRFPGEERWDFFLRQLAAQPAAAGGPPELAVPGAASVARLAVVQAPILRTRLDPEFAGEIRERLAGSPRFRERLRASGAGGEVVAVAFPRPGPNWYRQHHDRPQVSVFVMMARLKPGAALEELFRPGGRVLRGAFTAEMDFQIERPADSIGEITAIGPRRDLEERWQFFLSGLGGSGLPMHRH